MARRIVGLLVVLAIAWGGLAAAVASGLTPKLGLDLQGGTEVILSAEEGTTGEAIEVAIDIMTRRIEGFGNVQEPTIQQSGDEIVVVQLPGVEDEQLAIEVVGQTGILSFRPVFDAVPGEIGPLAGTGTENIDDETGLTVDDDINADEAWLLYSDAQFGSEVLDVGPAALEGADVSDAVPFFEPNSAVWGVNLELTGEGAGKFASVTALAAAFPVGDPRRQIAIVLDGDVVSAPAVNPDVSPETGISGGQATITTGQGDGAQDEANQLASVLRYGALPVEFEVSEVNKVSGTLGADSLQAGILAGVAGLILVAIVLLIVYRALGIVAIVGLTVFGATLIALFGLFGRALGVTLTLAGVTGIIVSVGITADSYIVYFERVKENLRAGYAVADAAREGFTRAFRTILTADTVSLLAASLLWVLAVGAVKGFAISLGIATVLDIFVARFFTKRAVGLLADSALGTGGRFSIEGAAR